MSDPKFYDRPDDLPPKTGTLTLTVGKHNAVGLEANYALKLDHTTRQSYYQFVRHERGEKAVDALIAEVKKQKKERAHGIEM